MKSFSLYALVILFLLVVQVAMLPAVFNTRPLPNLLLVFVLLLAILDEDEEVLGLEIGTDNLLVVTVAAALLLDIFSAAPFGIFTISFLLAVFIARFVITHFLPAGFGAKTLVLAMLLAAFVSLLVWGLGTGAAFTLGGFALMLFMNTLVFFGYNKVINV